VHPAAVPVRRTPPVPAVAAALLGRSWLALALPAGALAALALTGYVMGGWGAGALGVAILLLPVLTAVLALLPRVRRWVAARRQARTAF
jgi:hypothetical protein